MILLLAILIHVTSPDGAKVELNVDAIVAMRPPRDTDKRLIGEGVNCMVFTADGKLVATAETCAEVARMVREGGDERLP